MQSHQRILVIGPAWIGDMVMAQSLFMLLRQQHPQAEIDVAAPAWTLPVLARMPEVRAALPLPFQHGKFSFWQRIALGRSWRKRGYDWALVLPNSWKSALLPWAAGIRRRSGWLGEQRWGLLNDVRRLDKQELPRMIDRFVVLGRPKSTVIPGPAVAPCLRVNSEAVLQLAHKYSISTHRPLLALCPGAEFGPSKRWPIEYYAQVAAQKLQQDWQVVLVGSPKEAGLGEELMRRAPKCINLITKTKLGQAIDLLSLADWVVCNDSGLMHIAAALGRRLICLFGATPDAFCPPQSKHAIILKNNLACQPCSQRTCPLGHHRCLRDIKPKQVLDLLTTEFNQAIVT